LTKILIYLLSPLLHTVGASGSKLRAIDKNNCHKKQKQEAEMPSNETVNGNGKLTFGPSVLLIPREGYRDVVVRISGVPHTARALTCRIDGATEHEVQIVADSTVRGPLTSESVYDSVFITLRLGSILGERGDSENPKLIVYDGEKEIGCMQLSLAPEDSDSAGNLPAEVLGIMDHRDLVRNRIVGKILTEPSEDAPPADKSNSPESASIETNGDERGDTESDKGDAPPNDTAPTDGANSTESDAPIKTEPDQGNGKDNPGAEKEPDPTKSASTATAVEVETHDDKDKPGAAATTTQVDTLHAPTVPAVKTAAESSTTTQTVDVIEDHPSPPAVPAPPIPTSNGHGTTVNVHVTAGDGHHVSVGAITVVPVANAASESSTAAATTTRSEQVTDSIVDKVRIHPLRLVILLITFALFLLAFFASTEKLPEQVRMAPCLFASLTFGSLFMWTGKWMHSGRPLSWWIFPTSLGVVATLLSLVLGGS
jgi:hypothetical protein